MDDQLVRNIVREELIKFVDILQAENAMCPARADGNLNARDFDQTLQIVRAKIRETEPTVKINKV